MVAGDAVVDHEPLYGDYYLVRCSPSTLHTLKSVELTTDLMRISQPRKFKIAIAVPPYNDVDVFCHDLGYIAILDDAKQLLGFNVTIGGGMGTSK